jgi:hypothetical protein
MFRPTNHSADGSAKIDLVTSGKPGKMKTAPQISEWACKIPRDSNGIPFDLLLQTSSGWFGVSVREDNEESGEGPLTLMSAKQSSLRCNTLNADKMSQLEVMTYFEKSVDIKQRLGPGRSVRRARSEPELRLTRTELLHDNDNSQRASDLERGAKR